MKYYKLLLLLLFIPNSAKAYDLQLISLDRFALEGYEILDNRNGYTPYTNGANSDQEHWTSGIATDFDIDLIKYGKYSVFYDGRVFGDSTNVQFRYVGLQYSAGFNIQDYVKIGYKHESDHILDATIDQRFPLQNYLFIEATLYKRDR